MINEQNQFIEPATYIYESKNERQTLNERNVDILLTPHRNEIKWETNAAKFSLPRGKNTSASLSTNLSWLTETAGSATTINYVIEEEHQKDTDIDNNGMSASFAIEELIASLSSIGERRVMQWNKFNQESSKVKWVIVPTHSSEDPSQVINYCKTSDSNSPKVLWEYKIDFSGRKAEYFILSEIPKSFKNILPKQIESKYEEVIKDLSLIGVPIGGESFKNKSSGKGVIGTIYSAWLLKQFENERNFDFPLRDSEDCFAGLLLPVDNFDFLMSQGTGTKMCDFIAIQIALNEGQPLLISGVAIECKYRSSPFSEASKAYTQASQTYKRFSDLFSSEGSSSSIIKRLMLLKIIQFGLQLSHKGSTSREQVIENRDRLILDKILKGDFEYRKPKYNCLVISTESGISDEDKFSDDLPPYGLWIRIPEEYPPSNNDNDPENQIIKNHRRELECLFPFLCSDNDLDNKNTVLPADIIDDGSESSGQSIDIIDDGCESSGQSIDIIDDGSESSGQSIDIKDDDIETIATVTEIDNSGIRFDVGKGLSPNTGKNYEFYPGSTELNQFNMGIIGDLGTGKTQLTMAILYKQFLGAKQNRGVAPKFLILDYKGSFINDDFVNATNSQVFSHHKIPLNLFESKDTMDANSTANYVLDILDKIFARIGPVQRGAFKRAVRELHVDHKERGKLPPLIKDVALKYRDSVGKDDSLSNILDDMVINEYFEEDHNKIISFDQFFSNNLIINLGDPSLADASKEIIVMIFLKFYYSYMYSREKIKVIDNKRFIDSMLVIDEAHNIMPYNFRNLNQILVEGREFGVGVILASQYFSHFKGPKTDYTEPLATWFLQNVRKLKESELEDIGLTGSKDKLKMKVNRIKGLGNFQCLYKTRGIEGDFIEVEPFYKILEKRIKREEHNPAIITLTKTMLDKGIIDANISVRNFAKLFSIDYEVMQPGDSKSISAEFLDGSQSQINFYSTESRGDKRFSIRGINQQASIGDTIVITLKIDSKDQSAVIINVTKNTEYQGLVNRD